MDNWIKEREKWATTCRRLQEDNSMLTHNINFLENKIKSLQKIHDEIIVEKNKVHNDLDKENVRLTNENNKLTQNGESPLSTVTNVSVQTENVNTGGRFKLLRRFVTLSFIGTVFYTLYNIYDIYKVYSNYDVCNMYNVYDI